jgi:hypothetical protein
MKFIELQTSFGGIIYVDPNCITAFRGPTIDEIAARPPQYIINSVVILNKDEKLFLSHTVAEIDDMLSRIPK